MCFCDQEIGEEERHNLALELCFSFGVWLLLCLSAVLMLLLLLLLLLQLPLLSLSSLWSRTRTKEEAWGTSRLTSQGQNLCATLDYLCALGDSGRALILCHDLCKLPNGIGAGFAHSSRNSHQSAQGISVSAATVLTQSLEQAHDASRKLIALMKVSRLNSIIVKGGHDARLSLSS